MELTVGGVITLAATTGVVSALLTQLLTGGREWWLARLKTRAHASYHALRLAIVLEAYAYACANFIADNASAQHPPDQEFPDWKTKLPELPPYPDDVEGWRAIDLKLAARALNLRNRIDGSQGFIYSTIEYTMENLEHALDEHSAGRGLEAWEIAVALRRKHRLDPVELIWDFRETLDRTYRGGIEARKDDEERSAMMARAGMEGLARQDAADKA
jgi:hypothetical protein